MWNFIIPLSLLALAGGVGWWIKRRKDRIIDPTEDFYHDHEDIWRKSA